MIVARLRRCPIVWSLVVLCIGCASPARVDDAFPPARAADPWILDEAVWSGTFDEAATALGDDAAALAPLGPRRVWIARYCHDSEPRALVARGLALADAEAARLAYHAACPTQGREFNRGDEGCWTDVGVAFRRDRLIIEVFGQPPSWASTVQAAVLATYIDRRLTPQALAGLP